MPILSVTEIWHGRTGSINERAIRRYKRIFRIKVSDHMSDPLEATATGLIPAIFDPYTPPNGYADIGALCKEITPTQDDKNPHVYICVCDFDSERVEYQSGDNPFDYANFGGGGTTIGDVSEQNPLLQPPDIVWGKAKYQEVVDKDRTAPTPKAVRSSNGERFPVPVMRDATRITLSITRNEALFPFATNQDYKDTVNSTTWIAPGAISVAPGLAKCEGITGPYVIGRGSFFARVTYEFSFRKEGWHAKPQNEGSFYLSGSPPATKTKFEPSAGNPMHGPFPLNATGDLAAITAPNVWTYTYGDFVLYEEKDFNALGLPT